MTPALFTLGLLAAVAALFAGLIRRSWYLNEALIAFLFGILAGPLGLGWFAPDWSGKDNATLSLIARIILALTVMEIALRLPRGYPLRAWPSLATILAGVMPLMALVSGLLILILTDAPFWLAMLMGAITIPTDPIISSAILNSSSAKSALPSRIRRLLSAEAGANDGAAFPVILFCSLVGALPPGEAIMEWFGGVLLREVGGGLLLGGALGYAVARLRRWAEKRDYAESSAFGSYSVAITLILLALSTWIGTNGFLAVFTAGIVYHLQCGDVGREHDFQHAIASFLMFPVFALIGTVIPWSAWAELGWRSVALAAAVILLRRLPATALLSRFAPALEKKRDILFVGWFGPIGVGSFFFAMLMVGQTGRKEIWEISSLLLTASLFTHGLTATPFTRLYQRASRK